MRKCLSHAGVMHKYVRWWALFVCVETLFKHANSQLLSNVAFCQVAFFFFSRFLLFLWGGSR